MSLPLLAPDVPRDLIFQARLDLYEDSIWTRTRAGKDRASYRATLLGILRQHDNSGILTQHGLQSLFKIVRYNDLLRRRVPYDPGADLPPLPEAEILPFDPGPVDDAAEPEPAPMAPAIACDPPLPAAYIALGWGFSTGAIVDRFRRQFADFPAPIPGFRKTPLWRLSDIRTWEACHQADLTRALTRGTQLRQARTKDAEIAALRAELAALKQHR